MATTIKLKNGSGAPLAGDLVQGEPALDLTNKRLYTEDSGGSVIEVGTNPGTDVTFADNRKAIFGDGSDLQISHDGAHSKIQDVGTGDLKIQATNLLLEAQDGTNYIYAVDGTAVRLYHPDATNGIKLATTATGIDVTGDVNSDSVTTGTFTSTGIDDNATSTAITIDSSENTFFSSANTHAASVNVASFANTTTGEPVAIAFGAVADNGGAGNEGGIYFDAGATGSASDNQLQFNADHQSSITPDMVITGSGNVGIGTTSPSTALHIDTGTTNDAVRLVSTDADVNILMGDNTGSVRLQNSGGDFVAYTGTSAFGGFAETMRIDSSGNVGIGTSSPTNSTNYTTVNVSGDSTGGGQILFQENTAIDGFIFSTPSSFTIGAGVGNPLIFQSNSAGSSERMRIDSSGNVGIGTASPQEKFHVASDDGLIAVQSANGNTVDVIMGGYMIYSGDGSGPGAGNRAGIASYIMDSFGVTYDLRFYTSNNSSNLNEAMRIDSSGRVGIGTTSPAYKLSVHADAVGTTYPLKIENSNVTSGNGVALLFTHRAHSGDNQGSIEYVGAGANNTNSMLFKTEANGVNGMAERMRIDSSGNLLVGTTSQINSTKTGISASSTTNCLGLQNANDNNYLITALNSSSTEVFRVAGDGDVVNTNNSYGALSDERLKSNIVDASSQIDDIMAVQVRSYTLNETGATHIGVVAQELEASGMSGLVKTDDEGMKSVKYSVLYMKAIKALQEAVTRIETLEAEVAALKGA